MPRSARSGKRVLEKKVTSFNLYADQANQIRAIMDATSALKDAPVLRDLLDEALAARRRKAAGLEASEAPPPTQGLAETLQTVQTLLLRLIGQGHADLKIQGLTLELQQETLAEAYAGRTIMWDHLIVNGLRERGMSLPEITTYLTQQTEKAKDHAYAMADDIRRGQESKDNKIR